MCVSTLNTLGILYIKRIYFVYQMSENPKKAKKYGNQVHLRLGDDLVRAVEEKATQEGITVTALMIKAAKRYLGLEDQTPYPTFDIEEIEERLLQNLSDHWDSLAIELEEKIYKHISKRVSKLDLSEIETRVSERVLERISQRKNEIVAQCTPDSINAQNEEILETDLPNKISSSTTTIGKPDDSVSSANTKIHANQKPDQDTSTPEQVTTRTTVIGSLPLFSSIGEGQTAKPSELARYLNEIEQNSTWNIHKLRRVKNRQLSYLKKAASKRKGELPLPMLIGEYIIDWTPSEAFEDLDNTTSTGKSWWIQRLPSNASEAERLIATRKKEWNNLP